MNRHFRDARYYVRRTVETTKRGLAAELEPVVARAERLLGREPESEPEGVERVEAAVADLRTRLEREADELAATARAKVADYRKSA